MGEEDAGVCGRIIKKEYSNCEIEQKVNTKQLATQSGADVKTVNMIEANTAIFNDNEIRRLENKFNQVIYLFLF